MSCAIRLQHAHRDRIHACAILIRTRQHIGVTTVAQYVSSRSGPASALCEIDVKAPRFHQALG
jgi:hypothetical protein